MEAKDKQFTYLLLKWNRYENIRIMPWKGEKDPYKIWLSEIILQQTRVEQGLPYYNNFIKTFPNIHKLANAPNEKIFKLWEGLGYYTRCQNLIDTARYISKDRKGKFPKAYEEIKMLKGVGSYTAAAIASFAFNSPYAVIDGNVFRVLSRIFGIDKPTNTTEGKKIFTSLSEKLLDKKQPSIYNQAIMDYGAIICKPIPLCSACIFKNQCFAFVNNKINELPLKKKKIKIKKRWFYYLVLEYNREIAIQQRNGNDIWKQLYEFPLIETQKPATGKIVLHRMREWTIRNSLRDINFSSLYTQKLSHQLISGKFIRIKLKQKPSRQNGWLWMKKNRIREYAFPRFISQYLNDEGLF